MSELLPVYPDRPAFVPHQGGRVYISAHDAEHLRIRAKFRQELAEAHPDRGGSELRFHRVKRQRDKWEAEERAWYAQYGLPLPTPPKPISVAPAAMARLTSRAQRYEAVRDYIHEYPEATVKEIAAALGITESQARRTRLRVYHHQPYRESGEHRLLAYLQDGLAHTSEACRRAIGAAQVWPVVDRLRKRHFDIRSEFGPTGYTYRLVSAERTHA